MKISVVTEGEEVELETLALDHPLTRDITDEDMSEIRLSGFRTQGRKLRTIESYQIFVLGVFVRKCLQHVGVIVIAILDVLVSEQRYPF
jgi:hypothetical protein